MFYKLQDIDLIKTSPEQIGELLIEAKKAYYTTSKPIMDDATYDTLEDILREKLPYHRLFTKIGSDSFITGFEKKPHIIPMVSQNKVKTLDELTKYFNRVGAGLQFVVQPKIDGLSVELVYLDGRFAEAITRGDGQVGDVISQNVIKMQGFVQNIQDFSGSIRAEIVVTSSDFKKLPNEYTNPRNAASGIAQRLDSKYSELCTLICYDIILDTDSELSKIDFLKQNKLNIPETILCSSYEEIEQTYKDYLTTKRQSIGYDLDGLVIKINDLNISNSLGFQASRPLSQVAYKFPASTSQSKLLAIDWQVGPLGTVTPVARLDPVEIAGAIISYASLANYDLIKEKNINIGDIVKVSRRGDVIPHIEGVVMKANVGAGSRPATAIDHATSPAVCPSCNSTLVQDNKYLKCKNSSCPAQVLGLLNLFCKFLDIQNISTKTIEKLHDIGKLNLPGDFYKLSPSDIAPVDGLGELSAKNILDEINKKRNLTLEQVFTAAAIPDFSRKRIRQLISTGFDTPGKLQKITKAGLLSQPGIQENLAARILSGLSQRQENISSILSQVSLENNNTKNILNGAVFCITGALSAPRKQIEQDILNAGGRIANTVSRNTTYLVTNEPDSGSSKLEQATRFGTKIISEVDLYTLLNA